MASIEIHSVQTISGNQPRIRDLKEAATQSFLAGTPIALNSSGFTIAWAGSTIGTAVGAIVGMSKNGGKSLATAGVAKQLTYGTVPNESAAVNIARPYFDPDGCTLLETADPDTIFLGQVGPSQTAVQADIGGKYGLTIDTDNHWYVDLTNTSTTVVTIVKLDPNDQSTTPRGVYFRFNVGSVQPIA